VVHPTLGLEPWFKSWYEESKNLSQKTKITNRMDKEVVALYLTAVNGKTGESGEVEGVSRAIFPTGKYRLVQSNLEYVVVPEFPKEPPPDMYGVSLDWSGFYDRYLYNDSVKKRVWDPFVLSPNKYRTPGLALSQKRMEELSTFLEKDIKTENDQTGIYPERPVMGESAKQVSEWINLIVPHWRNRWIFRSFPTVHGILIDKKRTQAILKYGIHNGGGVARYRKEGKEWVLVESRINILQ